MTQGAMRYVIDHSPYVGADYRAHLALAFLTNGARVCLTSPSDLAAAARTSRQVTSRWLAQAERDEQVRVDRSSLPYEIQFLTPSAPTAVGSVYVVAAGPRVKIGFSADVASRMTQLRKQSPYEIRLLHSHPGTLTDEAELHRRFAVCRVHGEWFEPDAAMQAWLDGLEP